MSFYVGCQQKVWFRFKARGGESHQLKNLINKYLTRLCPAAWFLVIPRIVKTTTKTRHHSMALSKPGTHVLNYIQLRASRSYLSPLNLVRVVDDTATLSCHMSAGDMNSDPHDFMVGIY